MTQPTPQKKSQQVIHWVTWGQNCVLSTGFEVSQNQREARGPSPRGPPKQI